MLKNYLNIKDNINESIRATAIFKREVKMKLKNKLLKIVYSECPKCGGEWEEVENYKVLLQKTFYFLRCKKCKNTLGV